jgi:septum formation protein
MKILLASNSPRRRQLMNWIGWEFHSEASDIDETPLLSGEAPAEYVSRLAREKAHAALGKVKPSEIVLAADTVVADGDTLLGKTADHDEAVSMLRRLRGRSHQVYTAITIIDLLERAETHDLCIALVPMRQYTDSEIEDYIASGDPFDKAGAYAIQHPVFAPVINFSSCYACVMGLPLCHVVRSMRRIGQETVVDVPAACQKNLHYECPVFKLVLAYGV